MLRKFFTEKQLLNVNLQELYDYIDKGFTIDYFQERSTPPLPGREPTTDLLHLKLRKLLEESEATSPTEKLAEGNALSHVPHVAELLSLKENPMLLKTKPMQSLLKTKSPRAVLLEMPPSEPSSFLLHSCYSSPF